MARLVSDAKAQCDCSKKLASRFCIPIGRVAEWSNAPDLKSGKPRGFEGSNPSPSASQLPRCYTAREPAEVRGGCIPHSLPDLGEICMTQGSGGPGSLRRPPVTMDDEWRRWG